MDKKNIDDLTDDEFEKLSEEGGITPQPESDEEEQESPKKEEPKEEAPKVEEPAKEEEPKEKEEEKETADTRYDTKETPHVPYSKLKKEREKRETMQEEYEEKLAKMQEDLNKVDKGSSNIDDEIKGIAKEHGVDEALIKKIVDTSKAYSGVDPNLEKRLSAYEAQQQEAQEDILFEKDFNDNVLEEIKKVDDSITLTQTQKVKDFIKEIAYQEGNEKVPLKYLLAYNKEEIDKLLVVPKGKKSAESSRPGSQKNTESVDYDNITGQDIESMSDKEFEKYSEYREKQDGSNLTIYRKGQKITN